MSNKKLSTSRLTLLKGTAASAAIAPFFIGRSAKAGEPEFTLKFATVAPDDTPWARLASMLRKEVEEKTDGRVKLKIYKGGALGGEAPTLTATKDGRYGGWGGTLSAIAAHIPGIDAPELPYFFSSREQAHKALDANRTLIHDMLWDGGFKLIMFAENGTRSFGLNRPVEKPADFKGLKIRTQENQIHIDTIEAFGASAVPMGITEVLSSLQTGVVDGYDNTMLFAFAAALYMATTHWVETQHIYQPAAIVLSRKVWETLPAEIQAAITPDSDEMKKIETRGLKMVGALGPQLEKNFTDLGISFLKPELAPFRKVAESVHAKFRKRTSKQGVALLDGLTKAL